MATVRKGNTRALLVVDVQAGVMRTAWDSVRVIRNVSQAVRRARDARCAVLWVQHSDEDLRRGSPEWQWVPDLELRDDEPLIHKHFNSAFEQTSLETELARLGVSHLVLCGAATNWCIRSTAYGALERGYDLTLIEDAHTTETMVLDGGETIAAATLIQDLNLAMKYLSYPSRTNSTAAAQDVQFHET